MRIAVLTLIALIGIVLLAICKLELDKEYIESKTGFGYVEKARNFK